MSFNEIITIKQPDDEKNDTDKNNNNGCEFEDYEKSHNKILQELDEIKKLSNKIEELFTNINENSLENPINFNWDFKKEYMNGFIEYKRTLSTYCDETKINKLIRQIHWRIYEGITTENTNTCYYIIGLEDSGIPSYINSMELEKSIEVIKNAILETELKFTCIYTHNTMKNYNFAIVKFWLGENNQNVEYFL